MPQRGGKAASRRKRQRRVQPPRRPVVPGPPPETDAVDDDVANAVPPVGTPDAREASSLDPPQRRVPSAAAHDDSRLSGRERAEYHYVERDLRNIVVLTVLMALALFAAWFAFNQLGLIQ